MFLSSQSTLLPSTLNSMPTAVSSIRLKRALSLLLLVFLAPLFALPVATDDSFRTHEDEPLTISGGVSFSMRTLKATDPSWETPGCISTKLKMKTALFTIPRAQLYRVIRLASN